MDLLHIGLYTGTFLELIITNYILLIIFRCTLTERYRTIITLSILTALNALQLYIQQFAKSPAQMYLLYTALMFGIAVFLFHGKWQNRVMAVVLYTITSFMAEIVGLQILLGMGYGFEKVAGPVSKESFFIHTIGVMASLCLAVIIVNAQKSLKYIMKAGNLLPILLIFGLQFAVAFLYSGVSMSYKLSTGYLVWVYLLVTIFEDFYTLQSMQELENRQILEEQVDLMQKRDKDVTDYYQNVTARLRNVSELKEEYEAKLKRIYAEIGVEYEAEKTDEGEKQEFHTKTIVDNIISKRSEKYRESGIEYELQVEVPAGFKIDIMELSSLMNNLLDNAEEALIKYRQESGEKGFIRMKSYIQGDEFVIETENSKSENSCMHMQDERYLSTKEEKGHGYGLQIIRNIAQKYEGSMELEDKGKSFRNKVIMKLK